MSGSLTESHSNASIATTAIARTKNVFISYSAEEKPLAVLFERWIKQYFHGSCEAFLFESSLPAGTDWHAALRTAIQDADVIVPLFSPSSVRRPWIIWEVSAGWFKDPDAFIPIIHSGMTPRSLPPWLRGLTVMDAHETGFAEKFILQLSARLEIRPQSNSAAVDVSEEIQTALAEIQRRQQRYDLFVSAPMSSLGMQKYLHPHFRQDVAKIVTAFQEKCGFSRIYPEHADHMPSAAVGVHQSLGALRKANRYVLIYPEHLATGCLAEAGFALACDIPSVYFVHRELPAFLTNRDHHHVRIETFVHLRDVADMIADQGAQLFDGLD